MKRASNRQTCTERFWYKYAYRYTPNEQDTDKMSIFMSTDAIPAPIQKNSKIIASFLAAFAGNWLQEVGGHWCPGFSTMDPSQDRWQKTNRPTMEYWAQGTYSAKPDSQHISSESAMGSETFGSIEELQSDQRLKIKVSLV